MKVEIRIPDIAENVESGIVAGILVSEGERVEEDQPVIEVETDKAATDIPSTHSGTVKEIRVKEGDEVKVDQVILILETEEEAAEETEVEEKETEKGEKTEEEGKEAEEEEKEESEEKKEEEEEEEEVEEADEGEEEEEPEKPRAEKEPEKTRAEKEPEKTRAEDIPASPSVRRLARESGVDLKKVKGTGPGNRITAEDVKSGAGKKEKREIPGPDRGEREQKVSRESMSRIRTLTASRMKASWQQIPHVTQFDEADMTRMEEFRQQHKDDYQQQGGKLTVTSILLKLSAFALQRFPRFNASIDEEKEEIIYKHTFHIGVAVDTDRGLLVPVVRDVDQKALGQLSVELSELAEKARSKKISPDDLQGGNFTISNLGGIGGTAFTPIVYSPQVAILGVSRGQYKQVYREENFEKRLILPLSLSYDHRVIDGAEGARFLRWICQVLEDPFAILQ
ncbi:MAG: 2-oxo acid dehydrogenase subunit E2 [Bacteroidales bacterium]